MVSILEEYNNLLKINCSNDNKFQYLLIKSELEFKLDEIKKSKESLLESIEYINFNENAWILMFKVASQCSEWKSIFKVFDSLKIYDFQLNIKNEFIRKVFLLYLALKKDKEVDLERIINSCSDNIEKSICAYLISLIVDNKRIKKEYCKVAYTYWRDNLAAAEKLYNMHEKIPVNQIVKLVALDKIQYSDIISSKKENKYNFRFIPLGGGNDVGASSYYLDINGTKLLIDAGVKIKGTALEYPNFQLLEEKDIISKLKYVVITHAHLDHCGAILELYKLNSNIKFIMTSATRKLIRENFKLSVIKQEELNKLDELLEKTITLSFNKKLIVENIEIELYRAGHILGAASLFIKSKNCNVFVTGDFSIRDQNTVKGINLPNEKVDILITENTYGNKEYERAYTVEYAEMMKYISEKIQEKKQVLIPAFSIGRSQEILTSINNEITAGKFRTYIDGGAKDITKLYERLLDKKIIKENNYYVNDEFYNNKEDFILEEIMSNTCCIVSSSGMLLEGSTSLEYAKKILTSENGVCILTGYQAEGTIGSKLKKQMEVDCDRYINIEEKCYKILAELNSFNLSAHANINEVLAIQLYLKANNVILVHGDHKEAKSLIEKKINQIKGINIYQSINSEEIIL